MWQHLKSLGMKGHLTSLTLSFVFFLICIQLCWELIWPVTLRLQFEHYRTVYIEVFLYSINYTLITHLLNTVPLSFCYEASFQSTLYIIMNMAEWGFSCFLFLSLFHRAETRLCLRLQSCLFSVELFDSKSKLEINPKCCVGIFLGINLFIVITLSQKHQRWFLDHWNVCSYWKVGQETVCSS